MAHRVEIFLLAVAALACGCSSAGSGTDPEPRFVLPAGDRELGRAVFLEHGCDRCHRVVGDADLQTPSLDPPGPDLGLAVARQESVQIVTSIIAPSHQLAIGASPDEQGRSPMPDLNESLTVADLLDLVAFLGTEPQGSLPPN